MAKNRLTQSRIAKYRFEPTGATRQILFDTQLPGFGVRAYRSGRKVYVLQYGDRSKRRDTQEIMSFEFKRWMAIPGILIVILFLGYRAMSARSALSGSQGELLKNHLQGEYISLALPDLKAAQASGDDAELSRLAETALKTNAIEFTSVGVKGGSEEVVAKVTISVSGMTPPDGKPVRYFLLRHRAGTWRVEYEVSSFSYYTKLF